MKFRNYCLVIMGNTDGVSIEIEKISETKPSMITAPGGGLIIATFSSAISPNELNDWFMINDRSFLLFDLNSDGSKFNITKQNIHEGLFGFLKTINLEDKTDRLLREINLTSDTKNNKTAIKPLKGDKLKDTKISELDIAKMSNKAKDEMLNKIMDNGVENLTDYQKKLLQILSKYR